MRTPSGVFLKNESPVIRVNVRNFENIFKVGDLVRYKRKRKVFDKKGYLPTYSLDTHKIVSVYKNRYTLDNDKVFYGDELINGTSSSNSFKTKLKENKKEMKAERLNKIDFKMPIEQIQGHILDSKRQRKHTTYFIHQY